MCIAVIFLAVLNAVYLAQDGYLIYDKTAEAITIAFPLAIDLTCINSTGVGQLNQSRK